MTNVGQAGAIRALTMELKQLKDEPLEGFRVQLVNDSNLFEWEVAIFGPPGTIYEGGYFKARMRFPQDYPYSPPSLRFEKSSVYHPNVYETGELCISILHAPGDDPHSGELPCERWNPTQNVRTILLSVVSLLNEPNTSSPANVDASVMYRRWRDTNGQSNEYELIVKRQVEQSRAEAEKDGIVVPTTIEDYIIKQGPSTSRSNSIELDYYDDDDYDMNDDTDTSTNESQLAASDDTSTMEDSPRPACNGHGAASQSGEGGGGGGGETFEEKINIEPESQNETMQEDTQDTKAKNTSAPRHHYKLRMNFKISKKPVQN